MTHIVSLEFLIAVLFIIDLFLVILLLLFAKRVNQRVSQMNPGSNDNSIGSRSVPSGADDTFDAAREILDMLKPLVEESRKTALSFDQQIREKRKLSKDLNDALDTRIISINMLLSRADSLQQKLEDRQQMIQQMAPVVSPVLPPGEINIIDQQNQIIDLYHQRKDVDSIAEKLSIPKGEVQLVIDLKEKFIAMEKG